MSELNFEKSKIIKKINAEVSAEQKKNIIKGKSGSISVKPSGYVGLDLDMSR